MKCPYSKEPINCFKIGYEHWITERLPCPKCDVKIRLKEEAKK